MIARRDLLKDSAQRRFKRLLARRLLFVFLPSLALAIGGLIFLNQERFALETIVVRGQISFPAQIIETAAREVLAERKFFWWRYDRYWFFPEAKLEETLIRNFPRLALANVQTVDWDSVRVEVKERAPRALWCEEICHYLDENGMVYYPSPEFSSAPFLIFRGEWPPPVATTTTPRGFFGRQPLPTSEFDRLQALAPALGEFVLSLSARVGAPLGAGEGITIVITPDGDYKFSLPGNFEVLVGADQSQTTILTLLETIFEDEVFLGRWRSGEELEYLDLRFADKIFYRFHGELL